MRNLIMAAAGAGLQLISFNGNCQDSCSGKLIPYDENRQPAKKEYMLQLGSSSGGRLYYFGAMHLNQPTDPQFSAIKKAWDELQPTIVFFEGPDRGIAPTDTATIAKLGESGYVRFLAKTTAIRAMTLEPSPAALYQYLVSKQGQEKVELYFLLNEAMRLRTRLQYSPEQIQKDLTVMIGKMQALTGNTMIIASISDLEKGFRKYWGTGTDWWEAPQRWFDPAKTSAETGGVFTNDINKLSSSFRNIYMFRLLAEYTNKGERVMAVVGRDHVVAQYEALQCAVR